MKINFNNLEKLISEQKSNWLEKIEWRNENQEWLKVSRSIALIILDEMKQSNLTKEQFANLSGIEIKELNLIVKGNYDLKLSTIIKLEKFIKKEIIKIEIYI